MSAKKVTINAAPGLCTLLLVLFIGLKLTGYITWSWWWVLAPAWAPLAIVLGGLVIGLATAFIVLLIAELIKRR